MRSTGHATPPARLVLVLLAMACGACPRGGEGPAPAGPSAVATAPVPPASPDEAISALASGVRLMEQFQHPQAEARFARALQLRPGWLPAQANLALSQMNQLDAESAARAEASARAALALAPADARTNYVLGYVLAERLGRFADALPYLRAACEAAPRDPSAWFQRGRSAEEASRAGDDAALRSEARQAYETSLELDPRSLEANYRLGRLLLESDEPKDAARAEELLGRHSRLIAGRPAIQPNYLTRGALALAYPWERPVVPAVAPNDLALTPSVPAPGPAKPTDRMTDAGLLLADLDADGRLDVLTPDPKPRHAGAPTWRAQASPRTFGAGAPLPLSGLEAAAAAAGDLDRDGDLDLVLASRQGNAVLLKEESAWRAAAVPKGSHCQRVTLVDFDHDGDLDAHFVDVAPPSHAGYWRAATTAWRNDGHAAFTPAKLGMDAPLAAPDTIWTDFDLDNAVDMVAETENGLVLFHAHRDAAFEAIPLWTRPKQHVMPAVNAMETIDADGDDDPDVVVFAVVHGEATDLATRVILLVNDSGPGAPSFREVEVGTLPLNVSGACVGDLDLDGARELVVLADGEPLGASRGVLLSAGGFSLPVRVAGAEGMDASRVACADVDGDGAPDLLSRTLVSAEPVVLWNAAPPAGATWAKLDPKGREGRSNPQGFGAKLAIDAGALHVRLERRTAQGACNVVAPEVVGLGGRARIDGVTTLWPSGIQQGEADLDAGKEHAIVEVDRQPSSCPMLYGWDGKGFAFLTDCFDTAPAGLWIGDGMHWAGDPDEVLRMRPGWIAPIDGVLNLSVAEFLNETLIADRVALLAVDHDASREVVVDEGVRLAAPPQPLVAWLVASPQPVAARQDGADVSEALARHDDAVAGWRRALPWIGLAETHAIELDLPANRGLLVLSGSLNFSNSANLYAASQASVHPQPARLELFDGGAWRELLPDCGVPAGFHKDVALELDGLALPERPRLRITTSLQVSWDRAVLWTDVARAAPESLRELPLLRAEKRWLGIPREVKGPENRWRSFPRDGLLGASPWLRQAGPATPDGDAVAEVRAADEAVAFVRPGEELLLAFDDAALGAPAAGLSRTHLLVTRGWVKDATPHTAAELSVLPLPRPGAELYP